MGKILLKQRSNSLRQEQQQTPPSPPPTPTPPPNPLPLLLLTGQISHPLFTSSVFLGVLVSVKSLQHIAVLLDSTTPTCGTIREISPYLRVSRPLKRFLIPMKPRATSLRSQRVSVLLVWCTIMLTVVSFLHFVP